MSGRPVIIAPRSAPIATKRMVDLTNRAVRELDRRKPVTEPSFFNDESDRPPAEKSPGKFIYIGGTTNQPQYSDGSTWQTFLSSALSFNTPAFTYGTTFTAGTGSRVVRHNAQLKFPQALMSTANSATLTLTDNATDQTLTGSLGDLYLIPASDRVRLGKFNKAGTTPDSNAVLSFNAQTNLGWDITLTNAINASVIWNDGSSYSSPTHRGVFALAQHQNTGGTTFSSATLLGCDVGLGATSTVTFNTGTNSWATRAAYNIIAMTTPVGAGTNSVTNTMGIRMPTTAWPTSGTAGTYTNAYASHLVMPTIGGTIRRGYHLATVTGNLGTEAANAEGYYCEDLTRGTAQRASFYSEGATTGTPTDVYGFYQGTAHVVGTNRYGARFTGATTGTPTLAVGVQVDAHAVGTTKWAFYGDGDASHFAGIDMKDATNIVLATGTGTKIGTATTQKLGFWNKAPVIQPATTGTVLGHTGGGGTAVTHSDTFTGNTGATAYTIGDIIFNLKTCGILAA